MHASDKKENASALPPPEAVPYRFVETAETMEQLLAELAAIDRVAVDTEADSLHCYREKLCLIQLSFPEADRLQHVLVDPLAFQDLNPLLTVLEQKELLLHGASYDLKMLQLGRPFSPPRIFDTEWAAKLLGLQQFGLANLVGEELGFGLSKQHQKADWGMRPLPEPMRAYAVNDTRFLPELADRFTARLQDLGRMSWLAACCERMLEVAQRPQPVGADEERWRISGSGRLQPRQLEILRRAWLWREQLAEKLDRPVFRVTGNEALLDVAVQTEEARILNGKRKFPPRWQSALRKVIDEALAVDEEELPQRPRGRRSATVPDWEKKFEALRTQRQTAAAELGIDAGVIAPRKALERLAAGDSPAEHLMDWQTDILRNQGATFQE